MWQKERLPMSDQELQSPYTRPALQLLPCLPGKVCHVVVGPHLVRGFLLKLPHVYLKLVYQETQCAAGVQLGTFVHHALEVVPLNLSHKLCRLHRYSFVVSHWQCKYHKC